ncbi:hypothetical protein PIIN_08997 [Serendipita indica DSM 11827]|uniref:Uncharacterized protein n=1 Tax=Serendipita indica (strain DSM 11827) TaxID=1109443 RepID=G4TUL9_SERID|nr:hypothetical protein PIIN_08997 [Serendipita indica DSM 11827]
MYETTERSGKMNAGGNPSGSSRQCPLFARVYSKFYATGSAKDKILRQKDTHSWRLGMLDGALAHFCKRIQSWDKLKIISLRPIIPSSPLYTEFESFRTFLAPLKIFAVAADVKGVARFKSDLDQDCEISD